MSYTTNNAIEPSGIASFRLENAGAGTLDAGVATLGQVFAPGEWPAGSGLTARIGGVEVPVQADVRTTWPDGSAKMVVLSVARPELAAGAAVDVVLAAGGSPAAAPAIDLMTALQGHSFTVDLAIAGKPAMNIDVLSALQDALAKGTASYWQQGELATQARVEILVPDTSMRLVFDVTAYKGGGFEVDAQFNNDRAMETIGGRVDYTAVVRMDGQEVARETLSQAQYQNWTREFSSGGADGGQGLGDPSSGWLNIRQDVAELSRLGVVADYDLKIPLDAQLLARWQETMADPSFGEPFAASGIATYMPTAGGRDDIGITTLPNTVWLITQDPRVAEYALGQAEAASGIPWHFWDSADGTWLNTARYPELWLDPRGGTGSPGDGTSTGLVQQAEPGEVTGWWPEGAHQPDLSFVPYVLTGERWMLDNLSSQAAWNVMNQWPYAREGGANILVNGELIEIRDAAWAMRQIENALWAAPDGSEEKAFFRSVSDANWKWLVSKIPEWTAEQGEAHGYLHNNQDHVMPWQQDYFASTVISAASRGNQDALTFLNWQKNFLIGRFENAAKGMDPRDGVSYLLAIGDSSGTPYKTWAEIGAAQAERGWSVGDLAEGGTYEQLALSTLAGIYVLTGDARALDTYNDLLSFSMFRTALDSLGREPQYAVTIPGELPEAPVIPPPTDDTGGETPPPPTDDTGGETPPPPTDGTGEEPPAEAPQPITSDVFGTAGNDDMVLPAPIRDAAVDLLGGVDTLTLSPDVANLLVARNVETLLGGSKDDTVQLGTAANGMSIDLAGGNDLLLLGDVANSIGVANVETVIGGAAADRIDVEGPGAARIEGGAGRDSITGGQGDDVILGGLHRDRLLGGEGADRFVFTSASDSPAGNGDFIRDFTPGEDLLVFEGIAEGAFSFIGGRSFTGSGDIEARVVATSVGARVVLDIDGDRQRDLGVNLVGVSRDDISAADFLWI